MSEMPKGDRIAEQELMAGVGATTGKARVLKAARVAEDTVWSRWQVDRAALIERFDAQESFLNELRGEVDEQTKRAEDAEDVLAESSLVTMSLTLPQDVREAAEALFTLEDNGSVLDLGPLREAIQPRLRVKCEVCDGRGVMWHGGQCRVCYGATTVLRTPEPEVVADDQG